MSKTTIKLEDTTKAKFDSFLLNYRAIRGRIFTQDEAVKRLLQEADRILKEEREK